MVDFPDSFAASLVTASGDFLDLLVTDVYGVLPDPSDGLEPITGALPITVQFDDTVTIAGFAPFPNGTTYAGRIGLRLPVFGEEATLYFDLFDEPDGASSIAALDWITVTQAIPVPGTLGLVLAGLLAAGTVRAPRRVARERNPAGASGAEAGNQPE